MTYFISESVYLFKLPTHLKQYWWDVVALETIDQSNSQAKFDAFIDKFKDFAYFKKFPLTLGLTFDVLIRAPGSDNLIFDNTNLVCVINLGDESSTIKISEQLITLEPCDACWVPLGCTIQLTDTSTKSDIDVLFTIHDTGIQNKLKQSVTLHDFSSSLTYKERIALSHGVCLATDIQTSNEYVASAYLPKSPWREPTLTEIDTLFANHLQPINEKDIGIIKIPNTLFALFSSLNLHQASSHLDLIERLTNTIGKNALIAVEQFVRGIAFSHCDIETKIIFNEPNLTTTTHSPNESCYMGLHIDYMHQQSIFTRHLSPNRISINFGNEDRYFLFVNLTVKEIIHLVKPAQSCTNDELTRQFFELYPDYPVVKLRISPGEAYIAPTQNLIHDGIGPKNSADIHLTFCGRIDLNCGLLRPAASQ